MLLIHRFVCGKIEKSVMLLLSFLVVILFPFFLGISSFGGDDYGVANIIGNTGYISFFRFYSVFIR